jgi:hypothetical protein
MPIYPNFCRHGIGFDENRRQPMPRERTRNAGAIGAAATALVCRFRTRRRSETAVHFC